MSDEKISVMATLDTVARGCALHADKCVGEVGDRWVKVACTDYDVAREAVAELIESAEAFKAWFERAVIPTYTDRRPMPNNCERSLEALNAALSRVAANG